MAMNRERRLSFGGVAELYDRTRPSYPEELVDDVLAAAGTGPALEVGAGTGKATVMFARRGVAITAVEPSAEMAAVLRRNCPQVDVHEADFERFEAATDRFSLIYSAQAWHWVAPEIRYPKAHALLRRGGLLAAFWNRVDWEACPLREELQAAYARAGREAPERGDPMHPSSQSAGVLDGAWPKEVAAATGFERPEVRAYPWQQAYTSAEYVAVLSTHSVQAVLDPTEREALLIEVRRAIDAGGGELLVPYLAQLCLAWAG